MSESFFSASVGYRRFLPALASTAGLILLLFWLEGGFDHKVGPGTATAAEARPEVGSTASVIAEEASEVMSWPGTVSARTEIQVSPKIASRIEEILVRAGDRVGRGQILVRLDDRSLQARLGQGRSALAAAQAESARYRADAHRTENLFRKDAATQQALDTAVAATKAADARVREAQSAIQEVETLFAETALRSPLDGVVLKRHREPGDTAMPGVPLLTLLERGWLRVEVAIPESCAGRVREGQPLKIVDRDSARQQTATVDEIAPSADPQTHTRLVKARLSPDTSLTPGAYVRVEQACGRHRTLLIPASAVTRSGQIESVRLVEGGHSRLRHIRTGKRYADRVEVLSGLREGDTVLAGAP